MREAIIESGAIESLFQQQLKVWKGAKENYRLLEEADSRILELDTFPFLLQFNRGRIISASSKVDRESLAKRACFLCRENRPKEQRGIDISHQSPDGLQRYTVLINPFPVFRRHLTIVSKEHTPQIIYKRFGAMLSLISSLKDYTIFYNGAGAGASAPDHFHLQAGERGCLPIESEIERLPKGLIYSEKRVKLYWIKPIFHSLLYIKATDSEACERLFLKLISSLPVEEGQEEPRINIVGWKSGGHISVLIYLRAKHRSSHYFREGEEMILISPGLVELAGVVVTPRERDFKRVDRQILREIFEEVMVEESEMNSILNGIKW